MIKSDLKNSDKLISNSLVSCLVMQTLSILFN
jgi:hypothetical protein